MTYVLVFHARIGSAAERPGTSSTPCQDRPGDLQPQKLEFVWRRQIFDVEPPLQSHLTVDIDPGLFGHDLTDPLHFIVAQFEIRRGDIDERQERMEPHIVDGGRQTLGRFQTHTTDEPL